MPGQKPLKASDQSLNPLAAEDCPLVANASYLHEQYNDLLRFLEEKRQAAPAFLETKGIKALLRDDEHPDPTTLAWIRKRLTRLRYLVGFIGLFQVGKSTTFNKVLGATQDDKPAWEGGSGLATTATITRAFSLAPDKHFENTLLLRYMTRTQYVEKRDKLGQMYGVDTKDGEQKLQRELPRMLDEALKTGNAPLVENLRYLKRMVDGELAHGKKYLREGVKGYEDDTQPYDVMRWTHIVHAPPKGAPHPASPLLREVEVGFRNAEVPPELELADLPGLGNMLSADTILTEDFQNELNGAFVFYQVTSNLGNEMLANVLVDLRKLFPDGLRGRVWVVLGHCDMLTSNHIGPDGKFITGLTKFLDDNKLDEEQVCFVCNQWYGQQPADTTRELCKRTQTDDPIPPGFHDHPALHDAFEALRWNGGINRLRQLVAEKLKAEVEREAQQELTRKLKAARETVKVEWENWENDNRFDPQRQEELNLCQRQLTRVLAEVENRRELLNKDQYTDYFIPSAEGLRSSLAQIFNKIYPEDPVLRADGLDKLKLIFPGHARQLEECLHRGLNDTVIDEVYRKIQGQFLDLPRLGLATCPQGIAQRWDELILEDRRDRSWRKLLPGFLSERLFETPIEKAFTALNGFFYREMMLVKIQVIAQQTMHAVRHRVRKHLVVLDESFTEALQRHGQNQNGLAQEPV